MRHLRVSARRSRSAHIRRSRVDLILPVRRAAFPLRHESAGCVICEQGLAATSRVARATFRVARPSARERPAEPV